MARALDGLKKIAAADGEERPALARPRRRAAPAQPLSQLAAVAANLVDGLKAVKLKRGAQADEFSFPAMNEARLKEAIKRQAEARRQVKVEERKALELARENRRYEAEKRRQEIEKIKRAEREKKRIKRERALKKIGLELKRQARSAYRTAKNNFKNFCIFSTVLAVAVYLLICLAVLRSGEDNRLAASLADRFFVPAAISREGIINYADFKKINPAGLNEEEKKRFLLNWQINNNLLKKYSLPKNASEEDLALSFAADPEFNEIGLTRFAKINQLADNGISLPGLGKFADEYYVEVYFDRREATAKFGEIINGLPVGGLSGPIIRPEGYYLAQRLADRDGKLALNYLFIKARTLAEFSQEKIKSYRIFILAN